MTWRTKVRDQSQDAEFHLSGGRLEETAKSRIQIDWHLAEVFPRVGFIVTNSRLPSRKVVQAYNGRGDVENRIKEGRNSLRWDETSCHRVEANEARLRMGVIA